jgi:hypothetical protein
MSFSKLNTDVLRQILDLSERKEALIKELETIETEILSSLHGQKTILPASVKKNQTTKKVNDTQRRGRGMMKENILKALTEAGSLGLKVPELSRKINATSASIHVWFSNVGKKISEIEKIGAGHFRIRQ